MIDASQYWIWFWNRYEWVYEDTLQKYGLRHFWKLLRNNGEI